MLNWWRHLSTVGKFAGIVVAITGAIVGVASAWEIIEPRWYVSRGELRLIMDKQAVAIDRQSIIILKGQLNDAKRDPAAPSSPIVKERIEDIEKELGEVTRRVKRSIELSK